MHHKNIKYFIFVSIASLLFSCDNTSIEEEFGISQFECSPDKVSFSTVIQPLIEAKCAIPGCHVAGQPRPNFNDANQVKANAAEIKIRTQSGNMPLTGSLTQEQIDLIACWVDLGASITN